MNLRIFTQTWSKRVILSVPTCIPLVQVCVQSRCSETHLLDLVSANYPYTYVNELGH
jgi:hypothetical protein